MVDVSASLQNVDFKPFLWGILEGSYVYLATQKLNQ